MVKSIVKVKKASKTINSPARKKSSRHVHFEKNLKTRHGWTNLPPVVAASFKNAGVKQLLADYEKMESEVWLMKRKFTESKMVEKSMKETIRIQKDKSRQLLTACIHKIKEAEDHAFSVRRQKDIELSELARELTFLQSNMMKEQKRLETVIADKQKVIDAQAAESDRLRKQNKKLQQQMMVLQSKSKIMMALHLEDNDMDTPSSEESSPKSSFSNKTSKVIEIKTDKDGPSNNNHQKPPVPSRAEVNRKLQQQQQGCSTGQRTPPIPPPRSRDFDSGRESSDDQSHKITKSGNVTITTINKEVLVKDEGFVSEPGSEDNVGSHKKRSYSSSGIVHQRNVSPRRNVSKLSVLKEHQVVPQSQEGQVTTVTYWTEPYL